MTGFELQEAYRNRMNCSLHNWPYILHCQIIISEGLNYWKSIENSVFHLWNWNNIAYYIIFLNYHHSSLILHICGCLITAIMCLNHYIHEIVFWLLTLIVLARGITSWPSIVMNGSGISPSTNYHVLYGTFQVVAEVYYCCFLLNSWQ